MDFYSEILREENMAILREHLFFSGLTDAELRRFAAHAKPDLMELAPDETISIEPGYPRRLGIVLTGSVKVYTIDYDGNKTIINAIRGHGAIGTMQFMMEYYNVLFEIVADVPSKIITMDPNALLIADESVALIQHKILVNVMASQRQLFISISEHLVCLSQKNIRDKIMRFLKIRSEAERSYAFDIRFSREELAAYLAVDRASLSRSLSELKREGIIDYHKNHFQILTTQHFQY